MKRYFSHYLALGFILLGGMGAFFYVNPNTALQLIIGIITSVSYVIWGLIHHAVKKDLHQKVVVEYVLIGLIAIVLLLTILRS